MDPFGLVEEFGGKDHHMIYVCPGNRNEDVFLRVAAEAEAYIIEHPMPIKVTIGDFFDRTWNADDPRLRPITAEYKRGRPAVYVTHLRRVPDKAVAAGAVPT